MNKRPDKMGPPDEPWFVLTDDGPEYFETEDDAREEAESAMEDYVLGGETAAARRVVWGRVHGYVAKKFAEDESDDDRDSEEDTEHADVYDYELLDVAADTTAQTIKRSRTN